MSNYLGENSVPICHYQNQWGSVAAENDADIFNKKTFKLIITG